MVRSCPLDLKAIARGSGMRLFLDGAEVWRGPTFLGTVSATWLAAQIQDRLDQVELGAWLQAELAAKPTRHLGPPFDDSRPLALPVVRFDPVPNRVKAQRRARRAAGKGRRRKPTP